MLVTAILVSCGDPQGSPLKITSKLYYAKCIGMDKLKMGKVDGCDYHGQQKTLSVMLIGHTKQFECMFFADINRLLTLTSCLGACKMLKSDDFHGNNRQN